MNFWISGEASSSGVNASLSITAMRSPKGGSACSFTVEVLGVIGVGRGVCMKNQKCTDTDENEYKHNSKETVYPWKGNDP